MRWLSIYGKNFWIFPIVNRFLGLSLEEVASAQQNKKDQTGCDDFSQVKLRPEDG